MGGSRSRRAPIQGYPVEDLPGNLVEGTGDVLERIGDVADSGFAEGVQTAHNFLNPFTGGFLGLPGQGDAVEAILEKLVNGEALTADEEAQLQAAFTPEEYAALVQDTPELFTTGGGVQDALGGFGAFDDDYGPSGVLGAADDVTPEEAMDAAILALFNNQPDPNGEFFSPADFVDWGNSIGNLVNIRSRMLESDAGYTRLDDATVLSEEDLASMDPAERAQWDAFRAQQENALRNDYINALNQFNLGQYQIARDRAASADAAAQRGFQNAITEFRERLSLDEASINQAVQSLNRQLEGLGESRSRAYLESEFARLTAPSSTTGGKTAFTGGDLGASITQLLRQGGVQDPENAVAVRYPGAVNVDIAGMLDRRDQQFGVNGPLTEIPNLSVTQADVPRSPGGGGSAASIAPPILLPPELIGAIPGPSALVTAGGTIAPPVQPQYGDDELFR